MKLLKAEAVAKILDVSKARVYELIRRGLLPSVKLGRQVRVEEQDLYHWINMGGQDLPGGWRWNLEDDAALPAPVSYGIEDEPPF